MPKSQLMDPNELRKSGFVKMNDIPVNQYNKTIKEGDVTEIVETDAQLYLAQVTAEVDEEATANFIRQHIESQPQFTVLVKPKKLLLIEDGSVDTTKLDNWDIPYICYRQGSVKPEIIDI